MNRKITIGITMGDPNGIGPEVIVKSLNELPEYKDHDFECVIYGSREVMDKAADISGCGSLSARIRECGNFSLRDLRPGEITWAAGSVSLECISTAATDAMESIIDAIVTAPISKEAIHRTGSSYPGHTEMLRDLTGAAHPVMMFDGGPFRVALVTIHIPLSLVPENITTDNVLKTIRVCREDLENKFNIRSPKIAVCGLNPHAGESGAFGREEIEHITPAILTARNEGIDVSGPYPADTLFYRAMQKKWDVIIAMYHDQGLVPFKMQAFDKGVNVTLGLPVIRTSPDHGTAYDIAWKGIADPGSMREAVRLAVKLSSGSRAL